MTQDQAQKLLDHAITSVGEDGAYLYRIANGEVVVRIRQPCYFLWSWQDLEAFCHERKKRLAKERRKQQRQEAQHAINPAESYSLRMPVRA